MIWCERFKIGWIFTQLLTIALISVNISINWKSFKPLFLMMLNMTFLTVLIILFHSPFIFRAADGLEYRVICF